MTCMSSMDVPAWSAVDAIFSGDVGSEMSMMSTPVPGHGPVHLPTNARSLCAHTSPCAPIPAGSSSSAPIRERLRDREDSAVAGGRSPSNAFESVKLPAPSKSESCS